MAINGKHDVNDAFLSLHPTAIWSLYDYADYSTVNWISTDITIPTEEEVKIFLDLRLFIENDID